MDLTPDEQPVVRRAVAAYQEMKKGHKGMFQGTTADEVLEELKPSPLRWTELAAFVIETAEKPRKGGAAQSLEPARPRMRGDLPT